MISRHAQPMDLLARVRALRGELEGETATLAVPSGFWRPLRPAEQRMQLEAVRTQLDHDTQALAELLATGAEALVTATKKKARKLLPDPDPAAVRDLAVPASTLAETVTAVTALLTDVHTQAQAGARAELGQPTVLAAKRPGLIGRYAQKFFRAKAFWITGVLQQQILDKARAVLFNASKGDKLPRHIEDELDESLNEYLPVRDAAGRMVNVPARIETIARTNLSEAWNEGRYAAFTDPDLEGFVSALTYTAVMDDRTREVHAQWDGVTKPASWWLGPPDRRPPVSWNCRCALTPVLAGVDDVEITDDAELPDVELVEPGFK